MSQSASPSQTPEDKRFEIEVKHTLKQLKHRDELLDEVDTQKMELQEKGDAVVAAQAALIGKMDAGFKAIKENLVENYRSC